MACYDGWIPKLSSTYWRWTLAGSVPFVWCLLSRRRRAEPEEGRTDFDGFLKMVQPVGSTGSQPRPTRTSGTIDAFFKDTDEQGDTRNPLDFDSFLLSKKSAFRPPAPPSVKSHATHNLNPGPTADMKPVTVLYGTEYGFSKEIAEMLCRQLQAAGKLW